MASDGGASLAVSLVEAAVRAAVAAGAPRRTVAAAAAAVASAMAAGRGGDGPRDGATEPSARQRKKYQRKKEKRRAAMQAASDAPASLDVTVQPSAGNPQRSSRAAGPSADLGSGLAAVPALAPDSSLAASSLSLQPGELTLQRLPAPGAEPARDCDDTSVASGHTLRAPASENASAGMQPLGRSAAVSRPTPYSGR